MKNLEKVKIIIGQQITRDPMLGTIKIDQSKFIKDLVIDERLINCNITVILIKADLVINIPNVDDYEETELHKYQWLIDKLIYLAYKIRPDIAFIEGQLSKYNANLRKCHLKAVKRIFQYLKDMMQLDLMYGQIVIDLVSYSLIEYANSNFAKDSIDQKMVIKYYFFLNEVIVL